MSLRFKKIEQLDSLRAICALIVILSHFLPEYKIGKFNVGTIGVNVFFTISGFLITSILLEQKDVVANKFSVIKNFIIKRALRLFPIYYLLISFFFLLQYVFHLYVCKPGEEIYYLTYTQNFLFYFKGIRGVQLNHTWSLAIEEQFYLIWPWIVVFLSNKNLYRTLVITILAVLVMKFIALYYNYIEETNLLTIFKFDYLGGGALIALLIKEKNERLLLIINNSKGIIIALSILVIISNEFYVIPQILHRLSMLILSVSLVVGCYYNFQGLFGKLLDNSKLKYLGTISYGLYLYHKPIPYFINSTLNYFSMSINSIILLIFSLILTFVISYLSYNLIEKYCLSFKEKFDL